MYKTLYSITKGDYQTLLQCASSQQIGGALTVETLPDMYEFSKTWKSLNNSGQQNCGIFISEQYPDRIIKCTTNIFSTLKDISQEINQKVEFNIFPEIYRSFKFASDPSQKIYIEMERFDCDVTDMLMDKLPKLVIESMNLDQKTSEQLFDIVRMKMPSTVPSDVYGIMFTMSPLTIKIVENRKTLELPNTDDELVKLGDKLGVKKTWDDVKKVRNAVELFNRFHEKFSDSDLTYNIYKEFMAKYIDSLDEILIGVNQQIFLIRQKLYRFGYRYVDNKFDNYAVTLTNEPVKYLGVDWGKRCMLGSQYYQIHILDWDSGLSKCDAQSSNEEQNIIDTYLKNCASSFSVHGQYKLSTLNQPMYRENIDRIFRESGISEDIVKIMKHNEKYSTKPLDDIRYTSIYDLVEQLLEQLEPDTEYSDDNLYEALKRLLPSLIINMTTDEEQTGEYEALVIAPGFNNFTYVQKSSEHGNQKMYSAVLIGDDRKRRTPSHRFDLWDSGVYQTTDLTKLVKFLEVVYTV